MDDMTRLHAKINKKLKNINKQHINSVAIINTAIREIRNMITVIDNEEK